MEKKKKVKAVQSFEDALKNLEEIAKRLEQGDLGLEESIAAFEKGMRLSKFCHEKLEEAERKIEILQKGGDAGIRKKEVKIKPDTGEIEDDDDFQGSLL